METRGTLIRFPSEPELKRRKKRAGGILLLVRMRLRQLYEHRLFLGVGAACGIGLVILGYGLALLIEALVR